MLLLLAALPSWHVQPAPLRAAPSEARPRHGVVRSVEGASVRVRLRRPLGIVFEEVEIGEAEGVVVADLVEDSNAWLDGRVLVGDRLKLCSAVVMGGESALLTVGVATQLFLRHACCVKMCAVGPGATIARHGADGRGGMLNARRNLARISVFPL